MSTWSRIEAERAFDRAKRARRRASLMRRLSGCVECTRLAVFDVLAARSSAAGAGVREVALDAITGTVEPNRAEQFDPGFRPAAQTRSRWQRIWEASERGLALPPVSLVRVGDAYAVRDGHHRVSVAKARGAVAINAIVA
jgi:hypothetical protein